MLDWSTPLPMVALVHALEDYIGCLLYRDIRLGEGSAGSHDPVVGWYIIADGGPGQNSGCSEEEINITWVHEVPLLVLRKTPVWVAA